MHVLIRDPFTILEVFTMKRFTKPILVLTAIMAILVVGCCVLSSVFAPVSTGTPTPTKTTADAPGDVSEGVLNFLPTATPAPATPYPATPTPESVDTLSVEERAYALKVLAIGEDTSAALNEVATWGLLVQDDTSYLLNPDWLAAMTESCMKLVDCHERASRLSSPSLRYDEIHDLWLGGLEKNADAANLTIEAIHELDAEKLDRATELLGEATALIERATILLDGLLR